MFEAIADAHTYPEHSLRLDRYAHRPLLRYLTPTRPIFRWNHSWSAARAKVGLEPYSRAHTAT